MSAAIFVAKFKTFVETLVNRVKTVDSASMYIETGTLNAGATKTVNLVPLLPEGLTLDQVYIQTVMVDLKVVDPDSTSTFSGQAVDSDAVMSYGITSTGVLTLKNYYSGAVTYWLRVLAPAVKP